MVAVESAAAAAGRGGGERRAVGDGGGASGGCAQACARRQLVCDPSALYDLNNCASLREHFPCAACTDSVGDDQPAFVAADAPEENQPGACLVNGGEVGCEGAHHLTTRLCACA